MKPPVRPLLRMRGGKPQAKLQAELPPLRKFQDAVQETFYPDVRELSRIRRATPTQLWLFDPVCYPQVVRMVEHFWPGQLVDLVDAEPAPEPVDDVVWDHRWSEWLQAEGAAQRAGAHPWSDLFSQEELQSFLFGRVSARRGGGSLLRTPHQVLHVTTDAPWEVVEAAYRALAKLKHPDVPGGSTEAFQSLGNAYAELKTNYYK